MDRYGASTREYSLNEDSDTYYPRRTGAAGDRDRAYGRGDSTRERATFRSGRGGTTDRFATPTSDDNDESEYEPRGGHHRHGGAGASGVRTNGTTRRHRREDPVIENLRREVREDEARMNSGARFGGGNFSSSDDNGDNSDSDFPHRTSTVTPRARGDTRTRTGGAVRTANGNGIGNGSGTTHRRHRRGEDPVIEQLRREVREDEARMNSGPRFGGGRGHYSDGDSEGETEFGRRLEREVRAGRRGNGVRTPPSRGHFEESDDDGMSGGGRQGGFCGGRPSGF